MKEKNGNHNQSNLVPTVTFLDRAQIDYLDKLKKDYFFKYGHELSRTRVLSELVTLLMHLGIKLDEIDFENESLWEGILRVIRDEHKTVA